MFRAKLYLNLETDCVLSEVTSRWNTAFPVNHEEAVDNEHIRFVLDAGNKIDEFVAAFENDAQVRNVERVDETHLEITKRSCGALPIIRNNHGMMQWWDRVNGTQRVFEIVVFRRDDLRRIVSELRIIGSVQLGQLTPYQSSETLLSDRQAEVVRAALAAGFYEWPRENDAKAVAAELGISHTTFLEHLRKAERTLLTNALSDKNHQRSSQTGSTMLEAATDGGPHPD